MRRTSDQFWIYCVVSVGALILSRVFVMSSGVFGACLSYMLSMVLLFMMYVAVFCYRLHDFKQNPEQEVLRATKE